MKIYIDESCKCHTENPNGNFREFEIAQFDGKCKTFIEGHRYCPEGESYVREDGKVFRGEQLTAWKDYNELTAAQAQYEQDMAELQEAYQKGVNSAYD